MSEHFEVPPSLQRVVWLNGLHLKQIMAFETLSKTLGWNYNHRKPQVVWQSGCSVQLDAVKVRRVRGHSSHIHPQTAPAAIPTQVQMGTYLTFYLERGLSSVDQCCLVLDGLEAVHKTSGITDNRNKIWLTRLNTEGVHDGTGPAVELSNRSSPASNSSGNLNQTSGRQPYTSRASKTRSRRKRLVRTTASGRTDESNISTHHTTVTNPNHVLTNTTVSNEIPNTTVEYATQTTVNTSNSPTNVAASQNILDNQVTKNEYVNHIHMTKENLANSQRNILNKLSSTDSSSAAVIVKDVNACGHQNRNSALEYSVDSKANQRNSEESESSDRTCLNSCDETGNECDIKRSSLNDTIKYNIHSSIVAENSSTANYCIDNTKCSISSTLETRVSSYNVGGAGVMDASMEVDLSCPDEVTTILSDSEDDDEWEDDCDDDIHKVVRKSVSADITSLLKPLIKPAVVANLNKCVNCGGYNQQQAEPSNAYTPHQTQSSRDHSENEIHKADHSQQNKVPEQTIRTNIEYNKRGHNLTHFGEDINSEFKKHSLHNFVESEETMNIINENEQLMRRWTKRTNSNSYDYEDNALHGTHNFHIEQKENINTETDSILCQKRVNSCDSRRDSKDKLWTQESCNNNEDKLTNAEDSATDKSEERVNCENRIKAFEEKILLNRLNNSSAKDALIKDNNIKNISKLFQTNITKLNLQETPQKMHSISFHKSEDINKTNYTTTFTQDTDNACTTRRSKHEIESKCNDKLKISDDTKKIQDRTPSISNIQVITTDHTAVVCEPLTPKEQLHNNSPCTITTANSMKKTTLEPRVSPVSEFCLCPSVSCLSSLRRGVAPTEASVSSQASEDCNILLLLLSPRVPQQAWQFQSAYLTVRYRNSGERRRDSSSNSGVERKPLRRTRVTPRTANTKQRTQPTLHHTER